MAQTISRMYGTRMQAMRAADELRKRGFNDVHVFSSLTEPAETATPEAAADNSTAFQASSKTTIIAAMHKAYIIDAAARIYADRVEKGGTLVTVHAIFGTALKATKVLDSYDPIDSGVPEPVFETYAWDENVPFSSAFQLRTLTKTKLPFEKFVNIPSIMTSPTYVSKWFGLSLLTSSVAPFSTLLGLSILSREATPFSSKLGLPLLVKGAR